MKLRAVPPNVLNAVSSLLQPYVPDASPTVIVEALQAHGDGPPADPSARRMLSLREAGRALGFSQYTARRRVADGTLPAVRIGGVFRVPVSAIEDLAHGRVSLVNDHDPRVAV
jgi:excisionase family DNA binding protein